MAAPVTLVRQIGEGTAVTQLRQQLGEHAEDGLPLNPDAAQPPFPVWMSLPATWSLLDTNPGTWRRSAEDLMDTTFRGSRLPTADRKAFMGAIEGLVADCQSAGACVSLLMAGRRQGGGAATAGIHIAFADEGVPATLGRVQDAIPRAGTRTQIDSGVGPAMLQRERMTMLIPGTGQLAALTSLQIFVPIPDTTWTMALATASAYPEITDRLETLLVEIARSVRVDPPGGGAGGAGAGNDGAGNDGASGPGRARADRATAERTGDRPGPLITDGFDGLVTRRLGDRPDGDGQPGGSDG